MTEAERRAAEARRLKEEPFVTEALAEMERKAIDLLIALPYDAHEERYGLAQKVSIIRRFLSDLETAILAGEGQGRERYGPP